MRVAQVYTRIANDKEDDIFPQVDSTVKAVLNEKDGTPVSFNANMVKCMDFLPNGSTEITFMMDGIRSNSWEVTVTDQRVIVRNPFTKGLIGKAKEKSGKASVGHMYYGSISNLSTFETGGQAVLLLVCYRKDDTRSAISIEGDMKIMKEILAEIYKRMDAFIIKEDRKLKTADDISPEHKESVEQWDHFLEHAWSGESKGEVSVFVPCKSWDLVSNMP